MQVTPEIMQAIRQEVRRYVNIILSGDSGNNDQFSETINNLFPGMPSIKGRPVMHPYGLASRAPAETIQVIARQGDHFGNRVILGHRDKNRPSLNQGDTKLYNESGQVIHLEGNTVKVGNEGDGFKASISGKIFVDNDTGEVHFLSENSEENLVLGQEIKTMLQDLFALIIAHTHNSGTPGFPTGTPLNSAAFTALQSTTIDNDEILSDNSFTE